MIHRLSRRWTGTGGSRFFKWRFFFWKVKQAKVVKGRLLIGGSLFTGYRHILLLEKLSKAGGASLALKALVPTLRHYSASECAGKARGWECKLIKYHRKLGSPCYWLLLFCFSSGTSQLLLKHRVNVFVFALDCFLVFFCFFFRPSYRQEKVHSRVKNK